MKNPKNLSVMSVARFADYLPESRGIIRVTEKLSAFCYTLPEKIKITDIPTIQNYLPESRGIIRKMDYRHHRQNFGRIFAGDCADGGAEWNDLTYTYQQPNRAPGQCANTPRHGTQTQEVRDA